MSRVEQNKHGAARIAHAHNYAPIGGYNVVNLTARRQLNLRFAKTGTNRNIALRITDALDNCADNNRDPTDQNYAQRDNHN